MRHDNMFDRPVPNLGQSSSGRTPVTKGEAEFPRHCRIGFDHQVETRHDAAPAAEPVSWQLLKQVCENHGPTVVVEKDNFRGDRIAGEHDLINAAFPSLMNQIRQFRFKRYVRALSGKAGCGMECGMWVGGVPFAQKTVVQAIGSNDVAHGSDFCKRDFQRVGQAYGRPNEELAARQFEDSHTRWITEAGGRFDARTIGKPNVLSKRV